jgi:hypothetical protein
MTYYVLKTFISAVVIVAVSELAKRSTLFGALVASLPLTSLLAFMWLYRDTHDAARIASLSLDIFWLVIPSLVLFLILALLLRLGWSFWISLALGIAGTLIAYGIVFWVLQRFRTAG